MSVDQVKEIVSDASRVPNLVKRCHVGGGEATVFWNEMLEILQHAHKCGFTNSIVTNGWWAKSPEKAMLKVRALSEAGVANIELSVDAMHQDYISIAPILHLIRAAKELDVGVTLRVCTTRSRRADAVLNEFPSEDQGGVTIAISRVAPVGRAAEAIPRSDLFLDEGLPAGTCSTMLNLTVTPNGDVFPCCAGSETCGSLRLGNALDQPLTKVVESVQANLFVRTLVHAGPAYFATLLDEVELQDRLGSEYSNICHLCNELCSDDELSSAIEERLGSRIREMLPTLVERVPM